jgi:fibro-slime domain-containing protein
VQCGDKKISGSETCDDGNATPGDGCDGSCQVEAGWTCPNVGVKCVAAQCGDGIVAGAEQCDDGGASTPGCDANCKLEPGYKCPTPGQACTTTTCGDGVTEGTEQCDDGNHDMGDGCTPFCVKEPDCSQGACKSTCGDGLKLPSDNEQCEDGNSVSGDGCSASCQIEPGYQCTDVATGTGNDLKLPIVIRDFKIAHPDMEAFLGVDPGIVATQLKANGKPKYASATTTPTTTGETNFDQWYSDVSGINQTALQTLTLTKQGSGVFQYSNGNFFPIDGQLWGNEGNAHNFHFTSEVRYWFEYKGGEVLDFTGDDDVWVFVNKQLAVDLGGVHGAMNGSVTLDATKASQLGLQTGKVYETVVFQAERHTTQSNYKLTLSGFTNTTSSCQSVCGDGIQTPDEACDDGKNDGSYGSCTSDCKPGPHCGDGVVQSPQEECDDGVNLTPYGGCAPGCKNGGYCGDGVVDSLFGEACDDGVNDGGYGECDVGCQLGPRCGDGIKQAQEECDDGNKKNGDGCSANCKAEGPA